MASRLSRRRKTPAIVGSIVVFRERAVSSSLANHDAEIARLVDPVIDRMIVVLQAIEWISSSIPDLPTAANR
jgi:hypothetical protein